MLISHLHMDHLHRPSLALHRPRDAGAHPAAAPRACWTGCGLEPVEVSAGDVVPVGDATVHVVQAVHDATRWPWGGPRGEAVGYVVQGAGSTYFAGDTSVFDGMGELWPGHLDVALLPVWGWGPNLRGDHMDPEQAAGCLPVLGADVAVPIHYGTFWPRGMGWVRKRVFHEPGREFAEHAHRDRTIRRRPGPRGRSVDRGRASGREGPGARAPSSRAPGSTAGRRSRTSAPAGAGSSRSPCGRSRPRARTWPRPPRRWRGSAG